MYFHICIVVLSVLASPVWSFSEGASNDEQTCKTLLPNHFAPEQTSSTPYKITLSSTEIKPKETIDVVLKGQTEDILFKGFMIQARLDEIPVGQFNIEPTSEYAQLRTCLNEGDTASHRKIKGQGINEVSFKWTAPDNVKGKVTFVGTLVRNRITFWAADKYATVTIA